MVMPGDNVALSVELITPIAMDKACGSPSVGWPHRRCGDGHGDPSVMRELNQFQCGLQAAELRLDQDKKKTTRSSSQEILRWCRAHTPHKETK